MTDAEHKLMVFMFAQQLQRFMALIEALKSKGVLEPDDIMAYEQLVYAEEDRFARLFEATAVQYEDYAEGLGVQTPGSKRRSEQNPTPPK
jgi:hypothetical protein